MNDINYLMTLNVPSGFHNRVVNRISPFHIICIFEHHENHLKAYAENIINGKKEYVPLFSEEQEGTSYVISESTYYQNKQVFSKLRGMARDNLIDRIATGVTAYFLSEHAGVIQSSLSQHPEMKNKDLLDTSVKKIKSLLQQNTFLAEEATWYKFYGWFKSCITNHVVSSMAKKYGNDHLEYMEQNTLNEKFQQQFVEEIRMDSHLMHEFIKMVEQYLRHWIDQIIPSLGDVNLSHQQLTTFLELRHAEVSEKPVNAILPLSIHKGHLTVMSNPVYQVVRESLSNHHFRQSEAAPWPTAQVEKGTVTGSVQIKPINRHSVEVSAWEQVRYISELDVDVLDALCSFFLSNAAHHQSVVEIRIQDLLSIRGLKCKRSGNGRRGGYEPEQIRQIMKTLSIIQDIWVALDKVIVYEKGRPTEIELNGRVFTFLDSNHQICDVRHLDKDDRLFIKIGHIFSKFLRGNSRQTGLLPIKTLQYNTYREKWEKKLIRYISWRWRTQARKENYYQPYKIDNLLQAIGEEINQRTPSRTKERFEEALDRLQQDNLIASWDYIDWDESVAAFKGWTRAWRNTMVIIRPPDIIKEQYGAIRRQGSSHIRGKWQSAEDNNLGIRLKEYRKKSQLTLMQTAEELDLSPAYISTIERGKQIPSATVSGRIMNWIRAASSRSY